MLRKSTIFPLELQNTHRQRCLIEGMPISHCKLENFAAVLAHRRCHKTFQCQGDRSEVTGSKVYANALQTPTDIHIPNLADPRMAQVMPQEFQGGGHTSNVEGSLKYCISPNKCTGCGGRKRTHNLV